MSGLRKNKSTCGSSQKYEPFMLGSRKGFESASQPKTLSMNTISTPAPSNNNYPVPNRTASLKNTTVQECMYWPASLNYQKNLQYQQQQQLQNSYSRNNRNVGAANGDSMFCSAPPKVYMSVPGMSGSGKKAQMQQQNIPCQVAPLGTDPMSLIKPLAPLTVKVQAPADLFVGNPNEPKTISISPAQLYGGR